MFATIDRPHAGTASAANDNRSAGASLPGYSIEDSMDAPSFVPPPRLWLLMLQWFWIHWFAPEVPRRVAPGRRGPQPGRQFCRSG